MSLSLLNISLIYFRIFTFPLNVNVLCVNDNFVHHGFDMLMTNYAFGYSGSAHLGKHEKDQLCVELNNCLDIMEPIEGKPMDEVVIFTFLVLHYVTLN